MQETLLYQINCPENERETCLALLGNLPFHAFEETAEGWKAYVFRKEKNKTLDTQLANLLKQHGWKLQTEAQALPNENWNARWEESFQPVLIGSFCGIRAEFHPPFQPSPTYELVIQPRMAFGTGHHETTYMMVELMQNLPFQKASVFDYGCGTGLLAILAARMGATKVLAIDIEEEACVNTRENAARNGVAELLEIQQGNLSVVGQEKFDFILANINRGVILASLPQMKERLNPRGRLLISGFLSDDEPLMKKELTRAGFKLARQRQKGRWLAFELKPCVPDVL